MFLKYKTNSSTNFDFIFKRLNLPKVYLIKIISEYEFNLEGRMNWLIKQKEFLFISPDDIYNPDDVIILPGFSFYDLEEFKKNYPSELYINYNRKKLPIISVFSAKRDRNDIIEFNKILYQYFNKNFYEYYRSDLCYSFRFLTRKNFKIIKKVSFNELFYTAKNQLIFIKKARIKI